MSTERIFAEDLSKRFDGFLAVDSVSFQVNAGEVLVLLGPNGAGKTTTIRMLSSVLRPTAGKARVAGYDVTSHPEKVRSSVGVLTEHHGLYHRMAAPEYLLFFSGLYNIPPSTARTRINILLDRFGLGEDRAKKLGQYSKGMRQKLALVRAMLHEPPVLLLDEPTSAMDPESALLVRKAIRSLRSADRGLVLCTHNLAEAEELADRIAIIRRGKIILHGEVQNLKRELLGPPEYEARLAVPMQSRWAAPIDFTLAAPMDAIPSGLADSVLSERVAASMTGLPEGVAALQSGPDWIRFQVPDPARQNPLILKSLLEVGCPVIAFQEVPRSLEQVYMQAISQEDGK